MNPEIEYRVVEARKSGTSQVAFTHAQLESDFVKLNVRGLPYIRRKGDLACRPRYRAPRLFPTTSSIITCKLCLKMLKGKESRRLVEARS